MARRAPTVPPLFRSNAQALILGRVFLAEEPRSLSELSRETRVSTPTVHREVGRLEAAGLVRSTRVGNVRQVSPDEDSPYYPELRSLVIKAIGPVPKLREALATVRGVERSWIFGSWARRHRGESGPAPRDIDLIVVGGARPGDVHKAVRRVEQELGIPINATILSPDEWEASESAFLRSVREGALVPVTGNGE